MKTYTYIDWLNVVNENSFPSIFTYIGAYLTAHLALKSFTGNNTILLSCLDTVIPLIFLAGFKRIMTEKYPEQSYAMDVENVLGRGWAYELKLAKEILKRPLLLFSMTIFSIFTIYQIGNP